MPSFEKSVFINCPMDEEYRSILGAVLFCVVYLGFHPRISTERTDSFEARLGKIRGLMEDSKYSIHDLSRCKSSKKGEYYRLNMPLELGLDYGCKCYHGRKWKKKKGLVLEEEPHSYDKSVSDLSGFDVEAHKGKPYEALKKVRHWLSEEITGRTVGPLVIWDSMEVFLARNSRGLIRRGFSTDNFDDYPHNELIEDIQKWIFDIDMREEEKLAYIWGGEMAQGTAKIK